MPAYLPQTDENVRQMLETIGASRWRTCSTTCRRSIVSRS